MGAAILTHATFMYHQHVAGRAIAVVDSPSSVGLDNLDRHTWAAPGSAANGVGRRNLHDRVSRAGRCSTIAVMSLIEIGRVFVLRWLASFKCKWNERLVHYVTARIDGRRMFLAL